MIVGVCAASAPWRCRDCGTEEPRLRYPSGKMVRCKDCQRYYNLSVNAKRTRAHQRTPALHVTHADFIAWSRGVQRACAFCGIAEPDLARVGLVSTIGLAVAALGIDRISNDRDYERGNIQFCCFACNKAKGNVFMDDEMHEHVGPSIGLVWRDRLGGESPRHIERAPLVGDVPMAGRGTCPCCERSRDPFVSGRCLGCRRFDAVVGNATRKRRRIEAPGLNLARDRFLAWHDDQEKCCRLCGLPDTEVPKIGARTQVGHALRFLGIDRLTNDRPYEVGNIALCCYPCNKLKGNVFDDAEMRHYVGPAVSRVWAQRITGDLAL
jgi:hypothetical protein